MDAPPQGYRRNVGICLVNSSNKIFSASRLDVPGAWQMPQGGVDDGEDRESHQQKLSRSWSWGRKWKHVPILYDWLPEECKNYETPYWLTYDFPPVVQEKLNNDGEQTGKAKHKNG